MFKSKIYCLISGSGGGKDAIKNALNLPHVISYRTRPIRPSEVDGVDGHFVDDNLYFLHKSQDKIAGETIYNGYRYWAIKEQFKSFTNNEAPMIYVVDGEGLVTLQGTYGKENVIGIYIDVFKYNMINRMKQRGDTQEQIDSRIEYYDKVAKHDKKLCKYIISNDRFLHDAVNNVASIILKESFGG